MQRTILLAIVLVGLAAPPSWTQDPIASPAVSPPAPPAAETVASPAISTSIPVSGEAAKLVIRLEDEKAQTIEDYGSDHPKVKEVDARLAQAHNQITHNPEPPEPDSQESLQKDMEQAIGYLEMASGTDSPRHNEAKAKMAGILASYEQTPAQAKTEGLKLISQIEAEALPRLEAHLETVKSHRSVQSPESLKDYETLIAYWTVTVAKLKERVSARSQSPGQIQPQPASEATATSDPLASEAAKLIVQLEDERVKLLQNLGVKHPKIEELDARLAQARSRLIDSAPSTQTHLMRHDSTPRSADAAIYRKELLLLPYMQDTLSEMKKELDEIIQKEGKDHPDVAHLQVSVAEKEAKVNKFLGGGRAASEQRMGAIEETVGEMKQFLDRLPKGIEGMREERNNLVKFDPQNPRIRELDMGIAATKVIGRYYSDLVAAIEAGEVTPSAPSIVPLPNAIEASANLSKQITQLRQDYDAADAEAQRLAEQLRRPGSTASKEELRQTVERAFKLRQSLLRAELSEMLDRLAKTQHSIDLRDRITDQIVTRRVEELLNPQLEWDESKSGTQPVASSATPKESAPTKSQEWTTKLQGHWQLMQHTYEPVDTSDGKKPQPGDVKRENWNPETYYRKQTIPWKAMFDGHQMSICKEDGSDPVTFDLTFQKAGPPQQVDLTMELSQADLAELNQMDEEDRSSYVIPTFKGILEETPDGFRMCLDMGRTQTRPFLFVLGPDTGLWEFRREAAAPTIPSKESAQTQPQEWITKLQGPWVMTFTQFEQLNVKDARKVLQDGAGRSGGNHEALYQKKTHSRKVVCDGKLMTICDLDGSNSATCELVFRDAGPPQQIDLIQVLNEAGMARLKKNLGGSSDPIEFLTTSGIIEETEDGFQLCIKDGGTGNRPSLFVMGPETTLCKFSRPPSSSTTQLEQRMTEEGGQVLQEVTPSEKKSSPSDTGTAKAVQLTAEQLTLLFLAILERRPTDREEETWLKSIQNGQSAADVISTLLANNQVFNRVDRDKAEYIKYLHRLLMDRAPTAEELTYWTRRYDELQGIRSEVAREFLGSVSVDGTASELLARLAAAPQPPKPEAKEPTAPASQTTPSKMTGDKRNALMATQDIPAGYPLTHLNVQMVEIPASILASVGGDFIQTSEEFESRSLRSSAATGELIRKSKLNEKGIFNASSQIPKGMRINTFPVTVSQAHIGMLKTDDWVDVTVTFTTPKGAVEAKTLLEHVRVFAIEEKTSKGEDGQPVLRSRFVTLLVTPEQDGYIEIAKTKGKLSLALRNPDDGELVNANGLNENVLDELRQAIVPSELPEATATELEGDWHLLWWDTGKQKMRFAANMSIRGDQCAFSEQKTLRESQISVDEKAKTLSWSNLRYDAPPDEVPPIPAGFKGSYELNGEHLTIRSPEGRAVSGWSRGLCDLQAAKRTSGEMIRMLLTELKTPPSQGQHTPGDKVDVAAEWVLPDGTQKTGRFVELVEVDAVEYDEAVPNGITIICNQETGKLIDDIQARAKLVLIARQPGDEIPQLSGGMNSSVLTEIKAAAGADPVTPLEGDWYLESQEANGDVMGHRLNMSIRGDVWTQEFLGGENREDTITLFGIMKINNHDRSYVISEWTNRNPPRTKDGVRYPVGENGTYELLNDKLITKGRELLGNATLTQTWKRGTRSLVPRLSHVSSARKLRWRSGIVEIYQNGLMPDRVDDDEGLNNRVGVGVFVAPDGLIVAQMARGSEFAAKPDSYPLSAKFDDGSQVNLKIVEDAKNGWLALKPDKEMRVNYFYPIASMPTAVSDEVYQWGIARKGLRRKFDVSVNRILLVDRNVSNVDVPVMQLWEPDEPIARLEGLPVLSVDGELLAITMPNSEDLVLALPASRLKSMFPKSFSTASEPPAGPAAEGEKSGAAPVGEEKPAQIQVN